MIARSLNLKEKFQSKAVVVVCAEEIAESRAVNHVLWAYIDRYYSQRHNCIETSISNGTRDTGERIIGQETTVESNVLTDQVVVVQFSTQLRDRVGPMMLKMVAR